VAEGFTWLDGERLIRFGRGALAEAPALLAQRGFEGYAAVTTERAAAAAPALLEGAAQVLHVPSGRVDEISAELLPGVGERPLLALGGGRVIDVSKALSGAGAGPTAAVPTTLSGAPMTAFHRTPAGVADARWSRPSLVVADVELMESQPTAQRAASAMNALAHAMEALYGPLRNPVAEAAALRAAQLLAEAVLRDDPEPGQLALGSVLGGYAVGSAGLGFHHALCQTLVRALGTPHAKTKGVLLPHTARAAAGRAPAAMGALATALGDPAGDPEAAGPYLARLAARSGHTRLRTLGVERDQLPAVAAAAAEHRGVQVTPDPPRRDELLALLEAAL
jgi:alcohol dehydrogenase class IV